MKEVFFQKIDTEILSLIFDEDETAALVRDFSEFHSDLRALLSTYAISYKKCFGKPIAQFDIKIPEDFEHETCIDEYVEEAKKEKAFFNPTFNSKNYERATYAMSPGGHYRVKIYPILTNVTSRICLGFLKAEGAVLTSCQGLTMALRTGKEYFPLDTNVVSFDLKEDEKKNKFLCLINGGSWVAQATRTSTQLRLGLHYYEASLKKDACLIAFFKKT